MLTHYFTAANRKPAFVLCLIIFLFACQFTFAQESTPTPENPELKKLKEQNEILAEQQKAAEAQKAIAEANKAIAEANKTEFPKTSATPLEGKTEIDAGVKIESEMMAYRALSNASVLVAKDVEAAIQQQCQEVKKPINYFVDKECAGKKIAILNNQWLTGLRGYWAAKNQLNILRDGYSQIFTPVVRSVNGYNKSVKNGVIAGIYRKGLLKSGQEWKETIGFDGAKNNGINPLIMMNPPAGNSTTKSAMSVLASTGSVLGGVGSVVGAAIDLMALLRTDTKISGSTYTVQESAFVSQVYKELSNNNKKLFYPAEFSPNLNLNEPSVILTDLQDVSEQRAKGEQLVTELEETEKGIKEATATKNTLEERQKTLPDEIAGVNEKIANYEKSFPNPARRSRDVISDLNDLGAKLNALQKESNELPGKLKKTIAAIAALEAKRDELYGELNDFLPKNMLSPEIVVEGFVDLGSEIDAVSSKFLARNFTFEEVEGLSLNLESVKKKLANEAKIKLKRDLTDTEKNELFNPIGRERLKIFVKVGKEMISRQLTLNQLDPNSFLTATEQLKLAFPNDTEFDVKQKIVNKAKIASLTKLKLLNKQFDKFFEDIVKVDEKLGLSPVALHLQSENLMKALGCDFSIGRCDDAFALALKVIEAGGNNRTKKNLVTMIATGDNVTHSGGAIVEYRLYNMNGEIKTSSICRAYESYRKPSNINKDDSDGKKNAFCEPQLVQ